MNHVSQYSTNINAMFGSMKVLKKENKNLESTKERKNILRRMIFSCFVYNEKYGKKNLI